MSLLGASPSPQQHGGGGDEGDEVDSVHTHFEEIYDPDYEPTEEEVCDYARYLGFDLDTDRDLLWIARDGLKETLPPEWKSYPSPQSKDSSGREEEVASTVYYFNSQTGESSWLHPCDVKYMDIFKTEKQRMFSLRASTSNAVLPPPPPPPPPPPLASPSPSAAATTSLNKEEEEDSPVALVSHPLLQEIRVPPTTTEDTKRALSVVKRPQEEEDSFVRERLRRLQQENARLRDENQEMRDYAKQKAEEAHESHAKWLVAEYRCRGQEDDLARVKNELQANNLEWERRRRRLTQELDETVQRLVQAEEARDVAERKTRELLLEESTRAKHMEREIEAMQRKMAKAELLQQKASPAVNGHRKSQSPQRPQQQQPATTSSVSSAASAMEGLRSRFD